MYHKYALKIWRGDISLDIENLLLAIKFETRKAQQIIIFSLVLKYNEVYQYLLFKILKCYNVELNK